MPILMGRLGAAVPRLHMLVAILSLLAAMTAGCGKSDPKQDGAAGDTLVFARGEDSKKLDPADVEDGESANVITQIFDTLVQFAPDSSKVVPGLAESWSASEDGKTWTFRMRAGVKFHDGTPCDAAAVVKNFERLVRPDAPNRHGATSPYQPMYEMIEKAEAKGSDVVLTLKAPNATVLPNLAMFPACISSPTAIEKWKQDYGQHPVGTGPFKFVSWEPNQKIVLEANAEHWGGAPKVKRLVIAVIKENSVRLQRLKAGEVHIMDGISLSDIGAISGDAQLRMLQQPGMNFCYLGINTEKAPFDKPEARRAVAMAIDKQELLKLGFSGVGRTGPNPLPPTIWGYHDGLKDPAYDPAAAKAALEKAGAAGAEIDLYVMQNPRPYAPDPANIASVLKQRLEAAGLKPRIVSPAWGNYLDETKKGHHHLCVLGWSTDNGDPDNFLFTLLHSSAIGQLNSPRYASKEFDALVEDAQKTPDIAKRTELYRKAQEVLQRDQPMVVLAYLPILYATRANVAGFTPHPITLRLKDVQLAK